MKSHNSLSCIVFTLVSAVLAGTTANSAPKMKLENPVFDFGNTPEGLPVMHGYWLHSVGTDTLKIFSVRPSCGCTTVPLTKKEIAPGDSVRLDLKFDTKRFKGQISKTAALQTNDTTQSDATLRFTARVGLWEGTIIPKPVEVYLDTLGKTEQTVILKNSGSDAYQISIASPLAEYLDCSLSSNELPGKGEVSVKIAATSKTPIGEYITSVTLHFEGSQPQNLTIPVYGLGFLP